jgi:protease IV
MKPFVPAALLLVAQLAAGCAVSCQPADEHLIQLPDPQVRQVVEMALTPPPDEDAGGDLFGPPTPEMSDVMRKLEEVALRDAIGGLFLRVGPMGGAWGRAGDLIDALQAVREAGKPVHCHAEAADNVAALVLMTACDRVSMTPAGLLELVGPAAHVFLARNLLDKVGVRAELVQVGRYKGAADPLTRDTLSDEVREALGAILDGLHAKLVDALVTHRDIAPARAPSIIDGGPYDPESARALGLIDHVAFDDEAREHARRAAEAETVERVSLFPRRERMGLRDLLRALAGDPPGRVPDGPRVGLVVLNGTITDGERDALQGIQSGPTVRALRRMADDDDIRAVVLRIDSPGGSALASDRIWHAVRRVAKRKPVIASLGDMAASGGYYVAAAATEIIAHDASLVGSIGVVGGKIRVDDLAERIGLSVVVETRGAHAAWMSPFTELGDSEREMLEAHLQRTYARFIGRVARARDMDREQVRAAADGRLMLGSKAREMGLVDDHGGLADALARARALGELPADAPVERWPRPRGMLDTLARAMGGGGEASIGQLLGDTDLAQPLRELAALPALLRHERAAVALPFVVRIR